MRPLEAYEPMREIAHDLWCVDGEWEKTVFRRRMTIIRTRSGLVVHSPIRLEEKDVGTLEKLGKIAYVVKPNIFHGSEADWYLKRFPGSVLISPGDVWPPELESELRCIPIRGTWYRESAFIHHSSQTLVLTDLAFNMQGEYAGFTRHILKWNGILHQFGPSRICKYVLTRNRTEVRESVAEVLKHPITRIIPNHGQIVEQEGSRLMREAFADF